jgi:hypothetical protein
MILSEFLYDHHYLSAFAGYERWAISSAARLNLYPSFPEMDSVISHK